jgi:hypothetical protein
MIGTNYDVWVAKRSELNHNWLSNEYLDKLQALKAYLEAALNNDKEKYSIEIERIYTDHFLQWGQKKDEFLALINNMESALSPRRLFDNDPLKKISVSNKKWLESLVHFVWKRSKNVDTKTKYLLKHCEKIDIKYSELKTEYNKIDIRDKTLISSYIKSLECYISLCNDLHVQLSGLIQLEKVI